MLRWSLTFGLKSVEKRLPKPTFLNWRSLTHIFFSTCGVILLQRSLEPIRDKFQENSENSLLVGHHERVISSKHPMCGGCCGQTVVYVSIQKYVCKHTFFYGKSRQVSNLIYKRSLWLLCAKTGAVADGWRRRDADLNFKWTCLLWPRTSNTYKTKQNCIPQVLTSSNCIFWKGLKVVRQSAWRRSFVVCQLPTAFDIFHPH